MMNMMIAAFIRFLPFGISEALELTSSVAPKIARPSAIMVGKVATCKTRLRPELAVARLATRFTTPEVAASTERALMSERTVLETSSLLAYYQQRHLWYIKALTYTRFKRPIVASRSGLKPIASRMAAHSMSVLLVGFCVWEIVKPAPAIRITLNIAR
jgi:hypothetical protein